MLRRMMKSLVTRACTVQIPIATAFVMLVFSFAGVSKSFGQTAQPFGSPVYLGGKVVVAFDSTTGASPGLYHSGIDYHGRLYVADFVVAAATGVVHSITINGNGDHGFGNCVIIRHAVVISSSGKTYPYYTLYGHLDTIASKLTVGQVVNKGQMLGVMGATGEGKRDRWPGPPHLHFEVKTSGILPNPTGTGTYYGYMPKSATNYGYVNPATVIDSWNVVPISR